MPLTSKRPHADSSENRFELAKPDSETHFCDSCVSQTTYPQPCLGVGWRPSTPFFGTLPSPLTLLLARSSPGAATLIGVCCPLRARGGKSKGGSRFCVLSDFRVANFCLVLYIFLIWKSFCIMFSIVLRFEVSTKWKTLFIFCGFNRFNYQYIENL